MDWGMMQHIFDTEECTPKIKRIKLTSVRESPEEASRLELVRLLFGNSENRANPQYERMKGVFGFNQREWEALSDKQVFGVFTYFFLQEVWAADDVVRAIDRLIIFVRRHDYEDGGPRPAMLSACLASCALPNLVYFTAFLRLIVLIPWGDDYLVAIPDRVHSVLVPKCDSPRAVESNLDWVRHLLHAQPHMLAYFSECYVGLQVFQRGLDFYRDRSVIGEDFCTVPAHMSVLNAFRFTNGQPNFDLILLILRNLVVTLRAVYGRSLKALHQELGRFLDICELKMLLETLCGCRILEERDGLYFALVY